MAALLWAAQPKYSTAIVASSIFDLLCYYGWLIWRLLLLSRYRILYWPHGPQADCPLRAKSTLSLPHTRSKGRHIRLWPTGGQTVVTSFLNSRSLLNALPYDAVLANIILSFPVLIGHYWPMTYESAATFLSPSFIKSEIVILFSFCRSFLWMMFIIFILWLWAKPAWCDIDCFFDALRRCFAPMFMCRLIFQHSIWYIHYA